MLDIQQLRDDPASVKERIATKGGDPGVDDAVALDCRRREVLKQVEALKGQGNTASKALGQRKKQGEDISGDQKALRELGDQIKDLDQEVRGVEADLQSVLLRLPNLPHPETPVGKDEADNVEVRRWGECRTFDFEAKPHYEIGEVLGILDFERSARMSGSGFPMLMGAGARLQRALIQFMLDVHTQEHGYTEVAPPFLVNNEAMTGTGQLPKLAEEMYRVGEDGLWLIPTAEVPLTNIYREEIIEEPLPICLTAHTPCWRREAGAAGRETRGMIRVHQFDKVEMVKFVEPAGSYDELETLVTHATDILERLELNYRVLELCTGELSFAAARCYDIELWAPGQSQWLEVSSCSNFEDFQARRAGIRYRTPEGKPAFVHTLNGSGVALPRLMVALLENGQQPDGTVILPTAIRPYLGGLEGLG